MKKKILVFGWKNSLLKKAVMRKFLQMMTLVIQTFTCEFN